MTPMASIPATTADAGSKGVLPARRYSASNDKQIYQSNFAADAPGSQVRGSAGGSGKEPPIGESRKAWGTPEPSPSNFSQSNTSDSFHSGVNNASLSGTALPPLTGNKEADADIMAFYKAKEELLKKRGQQSSSLPYVGSGR